MSAFMIPEYIETSYAIVSNARGESYSIPLPLPCELGLGEFVESEETGILWRLSAPGYMDCTEWSSGGSTDR